MKNHPVHIDCCVHTGQYFNIGREFYAADAEMETFTISAHTFVYNILCIGTYNNINGRALSLANYYTLPYISRFGNILLYPNTQTHIQLEPY